jgi:hypothetical protein
VDAWHLRSYQPIYFERLTMSNTEALPKLPEPARQVVYNEAKGYTFDAYTADQTREFGNQQFNAGREFERERLAAQPAASGEPAAPECDSPKLCAVNGACAGQYGTKKQCATAQPAPALVPLLDERIEQGAADAGYNVYKLTAFVRGARFAEQCHGIGTPAKEAPHAAPDAPQSHPQR